MLTNGFRGMALSRHPGRADPAEHATTDYGDPAVFIGQKARVKKRLVYVGGVLAGLGLLLLTAAFLAG
jgi:hypothetical protein